MLLAKRVLNPDPESIAVPKPDVIFIHGTGSNSQMWESQAAALSDLGHRCFLIDLRGHGGSPEPYEPTNIDLHLADMRETLEQSDARYPAIFVGHSLGAIISMELAERHPEMFGEIMAAGMPGRVFAIVVFLFQIILLFPYEKLRDTRLHQMMPWRLHTLVKTDRFTLLQIVENFKELNYVDRTFNVSCPVHFSVGRFDPVAPCVYVKEMHRKLPQSTLRIFEFAGHNFMDQYAPQFNEWLIGSLLPDAHQTN
jgi:pimeloyl-ACP methyl ester carboxylesterase